MNKQEAIEIIEQSKIKIANRGRVIFKAGEIIVENVQVDYVPLEVVVNTIDQIHEPQKVVVPKFVAEWIEHCKGRRSTLYFAFTPSRMSRELNEWMALGKNDDIFTRAWLDGYEIEQEKLYTVEIPNPVLTDNSDSVTVLMKIDSGVILTDVVNYIGRKQEPVYQLTESEIKEDFEWAWDAGFAKEVE